MSIHVKLDLGNPAELEAFGAFCTAVAAARRAEPPRQSVLDMLYSGVSRAPGIWKTAVAPDATFTMDVGTAPVGNGVETAPETGNEPAADTPKRERGKPSPGRARRTKEEIAEDDAAANAPTIASMTTLPDDSTPEQVAEAFAGLKAAISTTPEDRQDPENPEPADDAETVAQDAADEAAETAETKTGLTLDDVRNVIGIYVKAYGMDAAQADCPKLIAKVLGKDHDAAAPCKVSDLPDDKIEAAIAEIKLAGKENRFARAVVSA